MSSLSSSSSDSDTVIPNIPQHQHPFNKPSADLILRSSDNIDFRVHKAILAEASSVFEDMFSRVVSSPSSVLEDDPTERVDGLDVVRLSEDGDTVETLLRFCYPNLSPTTGTLQQCQKYLSAAEKYNMGWIVTRLKIQITSELEKIMQDDPLRAYAIACRIDLAGEAKRAAKLFLRCPLVPRAETEELGFITAASHQKLLTYRFQCIAVIDSLLSEYYSSSYMISDSEGVVMQYHPSHNSVSSDCPSRSGENIPIWFNDYLEQTKHAFHERTCGDVAISPEIIQSTLTNLSRCNSCSSSHPAKFLEFATQFAKLLDEKIAMVSFPPVYEKKTITITLPKLFWF